PSEQLDLEAELGFVLGNPTQQGRRVGLDAAGDHLFGVCLVNDWSARDIQAFESVPLGPFLGKSFATSVSPWVVPIEALEHARLAPPPRDVALATYLDDTTAAPWGLDIELSVRLNGAEIARPAARTMYWTAAQMVAHLTLNGASIRPGDLIASGTVSGPHPSQYGSLIELTSGGSEAILLPDGGTRSFLEDGDVAVVSAGVPAAPGRTGLSLGEVVGEVLPALPIRSGQGPR
ncbi:MAG TPA: fumarylacetoacetate hydrolase family protein, partial [Acidimicrobiales bacterium]|nr:fumarylacetoacetate hydrolase family protein [Acidimicrobiales bacterium]